MINKVLVAEDHQTVNISVQRTLDGLGIICVDHTYYCDDALKKVEVAKTLGDSYDLLITDLYFEDDGLTQTIKDGMSLIPAVRRIQPELKILVFSGEKEPTVIRRMKEDIGIDGYVIKARNDAKELEMAMDAISKNQTYFPRISQQKMKYGEAFNLSSHDIAILKLLANGISQKDIPLHLKKDNLIPCSLSSVEKRLNKLREEFNCTNNEQLIAACIVAGFLKMTS
ncbi:response regulator [Chitinophaga sp. sic0106]|uniref:DNA-binding response regulator n=1 Tax=Chitinophaga sp. sic0106 TaxID=2854785 RepID=UPI001C44362E|nr:response regulator [Chitinophaga sp. sic0106]MBV7532848.1 response regulator [Chitinophaga sp. sic0106]